MNHSRRLAIDIPNLDAQPYYTPVESDTSYPQIRLPSGHCAAHLYRYDDCKKVLASSALSRTLCNTLDGPTFLPGPTQPELLLNLDNPLHARSRATITRDFSPRGVEGLRELVQCTTHRAIDEMAAGQRSADLFQSVLQDVTSTVVCQILGIPLAERAIFRPWSTIIQAAPVDDVAGIEHAVKASFDYLLDKVQGRSGNLEDGFIQRYLENRHRLDDPLSDEEFVGVLLGILLGGDHNALSVMTKCIYTLLCAPELWQRLAAQPASIATAVNELIRLIPIGRLSVFPRIATAEIETSVGTLPTGAILYINAFLANRDPEVYPDPLAIDFDRKEPRPHLQFGGGIHSCMGPALAKLEISTVLKIVLEKLPKAQLAVNPEDIHWINGTVLRRPDELPIRF